MTHDCWLVCLLNDVRTLFYFQWFSVQLLSFYCKNLNLFMMLMPRINNRKGIFTVTDKQNLQNLGAPDDTRKSEWSVSERLILFSDFIFSKDDCRRCNKARCRVIVNRIKVWDIEFSSEHRIICFIVDIKAECRQ